MNPKIPSLLSISASLILLTSSASAALNWMADASSPNGEFNSGTAFGSVISYGTIDVCGTMMDYAVKINGYNHLRVGGMAAPAVAANNMFAVHPDGSADLYTSLYEQNDEDPMGMNVNPLNDAYVEVAICTFDLGTYNPMTGTGTALPVEFGVTAPNYSPNTVTGSDMVSGSNISRLNNNEELFSMTPIAAVNSPNAQVETNIPGDPTNLIGGPYPTDGFGPIPAGWGTAMAWEATTGGINGTNSYGSNDKLSVAESDFNVTFAPTSQLKLRRDSDQGQNSAFGFAAAILPEPIPEPSRALLLGLGLIGMLLRRQR